MTNANVMAVNVQGAAPVKVGKGILNGVADGSSKGDFDEALGRLQQEAQKGLTSAGKDDTSQDMESGDGGSGREGAPQNPLAMVMALPVQQLVTEEVKVEPAAVAEFSTEAPVSGDLIKTSLDAQATEAYPEQNLRSLLPQSDEAAVRNRDFLAMLSGDLTSSQRAEVQARPENILQGAVQQGRDDLQAGMVLQAGKNEEGSTRMSGQPQNLWQLGQPLQDFEPTDPLGMALRQAARPLQQETAAATAAVAQTEDKTVLVQAAQPQVMSMVTADTVAVPKENMQTLLGNNIAVESQMEIQPLRVLHGQESQGEMNYGQNQKDGRPAQSENHVLEAEEIAPQAQSQPVSQNGTGAAQVSFQQQIQEAAAPVESSQAGPDVQTDFEVPRQIVEQARLIRNSDSTEMVIHLKPEHLGDLTLKISVTEGGAVTASFHSDNAQVRTIIENSLVQLRQELSDQGIKVDSVEVFSGLPDGQLPQGQGQQAWQQGSQGRFAGERKPDDYAEEADDLAAAALAQAQEGTADDGVDYRV